MAKGANCANFARVASCLRMAKTDDELRALAKEPGWRLDTGDGAGRTGTLGDVARLAHERRARGEHPGAVRRIENAVELEMLELEQLWRAIGLPV
ncbi:MAG: hypothetical protein ACREHF_13745 [Rhizomicrobium sp.]